MNWSFWRYTPWIDTRARFVARTPRGGTLLDLGTSDGSTLRHFAELRPDIRFFAVDLNVPESLPRGTKFVQADLHKDHLDFPNESVDAVTCMHLVEHLRQSRHMYSEVARVLKPGGRIYVETPAPKSLSVPGKSGRKGADSVTLNFFDDPTHVAVVEIESIRSDVTAAGLVVESEGTSRNLFFTLAYPLLRLLPPRRERYVAMLHWMGWSNYVVAVKPSNN